MPLLAAGTTVSPFIAWYEQHGSTLTKLADPPTAPGAHADGGAAWSPDAVYLAVADNASAYLYKRAGGTLNYLATYGVGDCFDLQWSPDGNYLAVAHQGASVAIAVFSRSGDILTQIADPALPVGGIGAGVAWTSDGNYLALANFTNGLAWYDFTAHTLVALTVPAGISGNGAGCDWSPDTTYLAIAYASTPTLRWFSRSGTTLTQLAAPATLPDPTAADDCKWSPDGNYLAVAHQSSPYMSVYSRSGSTLTKLADPATLPTDASDSIAWSLDGTLLAVGATTSPSLCLYSFSGGALTRLTDPPQPSGRPTGAMEFVGGSASGGVSVGRILVR